MIDENQAEDATTEVAEPTESNEPESENEESSTETEAEVEKDQEEQDQVDEKVEIEDPKILDRVNKLSSLIHSLPSSSKYFPDFESRMVYLRHLAKLSKLPYWKTAKPEEIHALIIDLRAWIISQAEEKIKRENNPKSESLFGYMLGDGGSFPLDIYLRAGFSLDEDTEELEAEIRKAHPNWFEKEGDTK